MRQVNENFGRFFLRTCAIIDNVLSRGINILIVYTKTIRVANKNHRETR